jgi:hypothetical protein
MSNLKIYFIELENQKYFLHLSLPIYEEFLFKEIQFTFDFVKNNPPIQTLLILDIKDELEINYFVKFFMRHYGINNVRGGNYTDEILSDNIVGFLKKEINAKFSDYQIYFDNFKNILTNYDSNQFDNEQYNILTNQILVYINKKKLYSFLFKNRNINNLKKIFDDFEWIQQEVEYVINKHKLGLLNYNLLNKNYSSLQYKQILKNFKNIINIYFLLNEEQLNIYLNPYLRTKISSIKKYDNFELISLKNPEFLLDNFFYHNRIIHNWNNEICDKQINKINDFINNLKNISYTVLNLIDELEFDIFHIYTSESIKTNLSL